MLLLMERFQGISFIFSYHHRPESTAKWANVRIMPSLRMCFPITNAEAEETNTEQAREPTGLTEKDTGRNFIYDQVSTSLSSN